MRLACQHTPAGRNRLAAGSCCHLLIALAPLAYLAVLPALWKIQRQITHAQGRISSLLLVLLGGIDRLRLAGAEKRAFARWAELYKSQLELMLQFQRRSDWMSSVGDLLPLLTQMAIFAAAIGLAPQVIETGEVPGVLSRTDPGPGRGDWSRQEPDSADPRPGGDRTFSADPRGGPRAPEIQGDAVTLGGAIRLTNISFRYDEDGPLVLDAVNLQVRPGEFVAIVGPSGSGKSTLLRLLLGFEVPTEGVVSYDGRELFTLTLQEVRQQIGVVLQDAQLFPGDIFSNIVGLASNLTVDDAWKAAELAGLAEDIKAMPMGIQTVIGEGGAGLSSGQRQRLIIARALAGKPKILYLDEATSALDNRAQAAVSRSLHSKLQGTTRLAIGARISTVLDADRIYVLSEGKIVQSGRYSSSSRRPVHFRSSLVASGSPEFGGLHCRVSGSIMMLDVECVRPRPDRSPRRPRPGRSPRRRRTRTEARPRDLSAQARHRLSPPSGNLPNRFGLTTSICGGMTR